MRYTFLYYVCLVTKYFWEISWKFSITLTFCRYSFHLSTNTANKGDDDITFSKSTDEHLRLHLHFYKTYQKYSRQSSKTVCTKLFFHVMVMPPPTKLSDKHLLLYPHFYINLKTKLRDGRLAWLAWTKLDRMVGRAACTVVNFQATIKSPKVGHMMNINGIISPFYKPYNNKTQYDGKTACTALLSSWWQWHLHLYVMRPGFTALSSLL